MTDQVTKWRAEVVATLHDAIENIVFNRPLRDVYPDPAARAERDTDAGTKGQAHDDGPDPDAAYDRLREREDAQ